MWLGCDQLLELYGVLGRFCPAPLSRLGGGWVAGTLGVFLGEEGGDWRWGRGGIKHNVFRGKEYHVATAAVQYMSISTRVDRTLIGRWAMQQKANGSTCRHDVGMVSALPAMNGILSSSRGSAGRG